MKRGKKQAAFLVSTTGIGAIVLVGALSGVAFAHGPGYSPPQQDCTNNSDTWNTPASPDGTEPGCHDMAVNVESGGETNGDANQNNTRFVEFGLNQEPNYNGDGQPGDTTSSGQPYTNPAFLNLWTIGDPGTYDAPHSGCVGVNTDGTGGGTGTGCGSNTNGVGFEDNWDYDQFYCPATALLPAGLFDLPTGQAPDFTSGGFPGTFTDPVTGTMTPSLYQCDGQPYGPTSYGSQTLDPSIDTGTNQQLTDVLTQGLLVYFGLDDNTQDGEHDSYDGNDGTDGAVHGPTDEGAVILSIEPQWLMSPGTPTLENPEGLVNASPAFCADNMCFETTTQQQTTYYGCYDPNNADNANWAASGNDQADNPDNNTADDQCASGTPESEPVYEDGAPRETEQAGDCDADGPESSETNCYTNSSTAQTDPDGNNTCNSSNPNWSASDPEANCSADYYNENTPQQMNAEPGVQTWRDPDPDSESGDLPFEFPGAYVGTCGVYLNDSTGAPGYGVTGSSPSTLSGGQAPNGAGPASYNGLGSADGSGGTGYDPGYIVNTGCYGSPGVNTDPGVPTPAS